MQGNGSLDRDDEDVYFDDESAEVVISSLRLGDDQGGNLFTNSNWFTFQDDRSGVNEYTGTSSTDVFDDLKLNGTYKGGDSSADDEVVVGEVEELSAISNGSSAATNPFVDELISNNSIGGESVNERSVTSNDLGFFEFEAPEYEDPFEDRPMPEWVAWGEVSTDNQVGGSSVNPFEGECGTTASNVHSVETTSSGGSLPNGTSSCADSHNSDKFSSSQSSVAAPAPLLFEDVELEDKEKAMEHGFKEGIIGEAGPLKRNMIPKKGGESDDDMKKEFNDSNYWRVDQEVAVSE